MKERRSNRRLGRWIWVVVLIPGLLQFIFPNRADAIPAFARQVNAACVMCHTGFPKLNAFGFLFKQNGYRMPGTGEEGKFLWQQPLPLS